MGIAETAETRRILRQTPISFRQLLHSLAQTGANYIPPGTPAGKAMASERSGNLIFGATPIETDFSTGKGHGVEAYKEYVFGDSDVITWSGKEVKPGRLSRAPGQFSVCKCSHLPLACLPACPPA